MDQIVTVIKSALKPIQTAYYYAFNANKYAAGIGLSVLITISLFFVMVILISLGDSGIKEDNSVKLADVVMPERQIDTFLSEVDKPEQPEEQPEDIAQPERAVDHLGSRGGAHVKTSERRSSVRRVGFVSFRIRRSGAADRTPRRVVAPRDERP